MGLGYDDMRVFGCLAWEWLGCYGPWTGRIGWTDWVGCFPGLVVVASHDGVPWGDSRAGVSNGGVCTYRPGVRLVGAKENARNNSCLAAAGKQGDLGFFVMDTIYPGSTQNWLSVGIPVVSSRQGEKQARKANTIRFIYYETTLH